MTETPFKISIPDEKLLLLRKKLELATLPDELDDSGWDYGAPLADVRRLIERWTNGYDWRKYEAELNAELPQFTRDIEIDGYGTLNIHYLHKRSDVEQAIPLLFVHGWPGNFLEARKLLPLLTKGGDTFPAFHMVAVGLPGYGFSEAPKTKGFNPEKYAEVGHKLMLALGYQEYVTQGGDWGFPITLRIAKLYGGEHSKAWHINMSTGEPPNADTESPLTEREKEGLERTAWFRRVGTGYLIQQSTQPQTLGYSLADSPVGLLAWIYEKLVTWSDAYPWSDDEVLTWISIYWFSRAGPTASLRIYREEPMATAFSGIDPSPTIPLGISQFPKDILVLPKSWTRALGNVVFDADHERGGHFAAYEKPEDLAGDLRKMFGRGGPAFGVVSGKDGYAA
ncbi:Alpha/Beta hydrolase protein [Mycena albidolilacea]|uniref:Alpha/Beta hydrolase protein n=1 Tax=Mycena albidolilacea TaxID=1033008 RepID=A0AAD6YYC1_9AGAR|nr:Alpha/Beta hydrolase protein [Mycena albidolilacea]